MKHTSAHHKMINTSGTMSVRKGNKGWDQDLAKDQLSMLFAMEADYQIRSSPCQIPLDQRVTTEDWRRKICQWSYRVIDSFRLDRSIVSVAMNLLDRFLMKHEFPMESQYACRCISCKRSFDSRTFQLASMACLYIAIKISPEVECEEEVERRRHFCLAPFVDFSRGLFSQRDVVEMEKLILHTIGWKVNSPTPTSFIPYLLDLLPSQDKMPFESQHCYPLVQQVLKELARYLCELSVCLGKEMTDARPSEVAFVSMAVSMDLLTMSALPASVRSHFHSSFVEIAGNYDAEYMEVLRSKLMTTLLPEMLLDHHHSHSGSDHGHPIALARYYGLLDMSHLQRQAEDHTTPKTCCPPTSPSRACKRQKSVAPGSPVSIATAPSL